MIEDIFQADSPGSNGCIGVASHWETSLGTAIA